MATLDSDVSSLLAMLAEGGLTELSQAAARAMAQDRTDGDDEEGRIDEHAFGRFQQLDRATRALISKLKTELEAMKRLRALTPPLGVQRISVSTITIAGTTEGVEESLISTEREEAIVALLKAWEMAAAELRLNWELSDGDEG
jgi:hypothetical protein